MASKKKTEQNKTKLKESGEVQSYKQKVKFKGVSETFLSKSNTRGPEKAKENSISLGGD